MTGCVELGTWKKKKKKIESGIQNKHEKSQKVDLQEAHPHR